MTQRRWRTFLVLGIHIGKSRKTFSLKLHSVALLEPLGLPMLALYEFLGRFCDCLSSDLKSRIFKFLFLQVFRAFLGQNFPIFAIFRKIKKKCPLRWLKNKNLEIRLCTHKIFIISPLKIKLMDFLTSWGQGMCYRNFWKVNFWVHFPYKTTE